MTQAEISQRTSVGQATISRIINGVHKNPRWNVAWPILVLAMQERDVSENKQAPQFSLDTPVTETQSNTEGEAA